MDLKIVNSINLELSRMSSDYAGVYFFGSRLSGVDKESIKKSIDYANFFIEKIFNLIKE